MVNYKIASDIGVVRSENQDRASVFVSKDNLVLAILCDGMGGHKGGSIASSITVKTVGEEFVKSLPNDSKKWAKWFESALDLCNRKMEDYASEEKALLDMGTTVTAAIISSNNINIFNVGDSRTYIYNGLLHQITQDHNLRNYYVKKLKLSPEKAATIRGATALTSALGPSKLKKVDSFVVKKTNEVKFVVLTSDGIHDYVTKPAFEQILLKNTPLKNKANDLIAMAIKGKSADNLTTIILELN